MGSILTISDVTRMSGNHVCVAGYLDDGTCVRPQFQYGHITEEWLFQNGVMVCRPFAQIEVDFLPGRCHTEAPHTEDRYIRQQYRFVRQLSATDERWTFLDRISEPILAHCFDTPLLSSGASPKRFVHPGTGSRSLATVEARVTFLECGPNPYNAAQQTYEIGFRDSTGAEYRMRITDLALRAYLDHSERELRSPKRAAVRLGEQLEGCHIWLRVGFARGFDQNGATEPRCYLQLNGLYSEPDYLDGKCWGDFVAAPQPMQNILPHRGPGSLSPRPSAGLPPIDVDDVPF